MSAMAIIIARERRIIPARISDAIVNCIVPVVIVIGGDAVPAAVVRLERVMRPALAGISASNRDSLAPETQRPYIRRVRVSDARLDCLWCLRLRNDSLGCGSAFRMRGLPSTRATSRRAANASAISRLPFTKIAFTM